jgi:hypothetical protein
VEQVAEGQATRKMTLLFTKLRLLKGLPLTWTVTMEPPLLNTFLTRTWKIKTRSRMALMKKYLQFPAMRSGAKSTRTVRSKPITIHSTLVLMMSLICLEWGTLMMRQTGRSLTMETEKKSTQTILTRMLLTDMTRKTMQPSVFTTLASKFLEILT